MKLEIRNYKKYYETGYKPEINSLREFEICPDGQGGNYGYIHCTTNEEVKKYLEIIKKCGVAHTNNIERLICSIFIEENIKGIDILNAIDKGGENIQILKSRITTDGEWWYIDPEYEEDGSIDPHRKGNFCHHNREEAIYWCVINELTKKQIERYLY